MTIVDALTEAQRIIGQHWKEGQAPEQEQLLGFARDVLFFIASTGQPYRFEDYRKQLRAVSPPRIGALSGLHRGLAADTEQLVHRAEGFFEQFLDKPQPEEERALVLVILDALSFVASTQQLDSLEGYLQRLESNDPPQVVASFDTREQAESWLENHPSPPHCAHILVAGKYHTVAHDRETNSRYLPPSRAVDYYLASLKQDSPLATVASFKSLPEAEAWLSAQRAPPARAWVRVSGEVYLAVSHPNVHHRALYPLSLADGLVINTESEPESPKQR
jgi:hypothetical protein